MKYIIINYFLIYIPLNFKRCLILYPFNYTLTFPIIFLYELVFQIQIKIIFNIIIISFFFFLELYFIYI